MFNLGALAGGLVAVGALTGSAIGGVRLDPPEGPPSPPPATTREQCFDQYVGALRWLSEQLLTFDPPMSPEAIRQALDGFLVDLQTCLQGLGVPPVAPSRTSCVFEYIANLRRCNTTFPPVLVPPPPGSAFWQYAPHPALASCIAAAAEALARCKDQVATVATLQVEEPPSTVIISAGQKYLSVKLTVVGNEGWCPRFQFDTLDQNGVQVSVVADYDDCHDEHDGQEVFVPIPSEVFQARSNWAAVVVIVRDRFGGDQDATVVPVIIEWPDGDLNRDGHLTGDDIVVATQMYVNGELTLAQLNSVIALVQSQP